MGVRGFQKLPSSDLRFVYQLEAGFDVSALPGNKQTNSNLSNQVNGALFSRNSYIGLAFPGLGAVKIGKEDTPYKSSTAAFNPFSGMWGDYSVIMGNTGGDNRVEFGLRAAHAIWYESPNMAGWQFNVLVRARPKPLLDQRQYRFRRIRLQRQQRSEQRRRCSGFLY